MFNLFNFNLTGFNVPIIDATITPSSITSDEVFGTFSVNPGSVVVTPNTIASAETFGAFELSVGAVTITSLSIGSAETFGVISVDIEGVIALNAIPSVETFGALSVNPGSVAITPNAIVSEETFSAFELSVGTVTITPSIIMSAETFSAFELSVGAVIINSSFIPSTEVFGDFSVNPESVVITLNAITSAEIFSAFELSVGVVAITSSSIVSVETFGALSVNPGSVAITLSSIMSTEEFGLIAISMIIKPSSIVSSETFSIFSVKVEDVITPISISSVESFGAFEISVGDITMVYLSIVSNETFGAFSVSPGSVAITAISIISAERFGRSSLKFKAIEPIMPPIVYDKLATSFLGYGLAVLENAKDICVREVLNGEYTLSFALPISDSKWDYIMEENFVKVEGQLFVIRNIEDNHADDEMCTVSCEHVFFLLLDEYIEYLELNGSPLSALTAILNGTDHQTGIVDIAGTYEEILENQNPVKAINSLIGAVGGEIEADNFEVNLLAHRGSTEPNIQFRYRKNIKSINRVADTSGLITRLYVYGNDGLTIEDAIDSGGKKYIDSQYINNYRRPKNGSVTFDIDDVDELYTKGVEYLKTAEIPFVSYEVDVLELKSLAEYGPLEVFALGDECMVIDEVLQANVQARIKEYERYPMEPSRSRVTLGNFRPGIQDKMSQFDDVKDAITTEDGGVVVKTAWLEGIINTLKNRLVASGAYATAEVIEGVGLLFENTDTSSNDYGAMYIGPGIFALAKEKTGSPPTWNWRTFGTGSGFTGDEINAGKIKAAFIQIGDGTEFAEGYDPRYINDPQGVVTIVNGTVNADYVRTLGLLVGDHIFMGPNAAIEWTNVSGTENVALLSALDDFITTGEMSTALANVLTTGNFNTVITKNYIASMNLIVGQEITMGPNAVIAWANVSGTENVALLSALDEFVTTGEMSNALLNVLTTGNFNTVITKNYIASMNLIVGQEIIMGPNAVITWANLSEESKVNLTGADGAPGAQGPQGPQGPQGIPGTPGDDANVPAWVTDWNNGVTTITSGYICSPKIFLGAGGQIATGVKIDSNGISSYSSNVLHGWKLDNSNPSNFLVYYQGELRGTIQQAGGNFAIYPGTNAVMTLGTAGKTTYAAGNWVFNGSVSGVTATAVLG